MYIYVDISKKKNKFCGSFKIKIKRINKIMKSIDIQILDEISDKNKQKLCKKLAKKCMNSSIVFSNMIYESHRDIIEYFYASNIKIVNGKKIYEKMIDKIIKYVLDINKNIKIENMQIGICINSFTYDRVEFIQKISDNAKGVTIVTNEKDKLDNVKTNILENSGMSIRVGNTAKILKNCNIVINYDVENTQVVNSVSSNCIYINLEKKIFKMKKSFTGIIINDILLKNVYIEGIENTKYCNCSLAETLEIEAKDTSVISLIGMKNKISDQEIRKIDVMMRKK